MLRALREDCRPPAALSDAKGRPHPKAALNQALCARRDINPNVLHTAIAGTPAYMQGRATPAETSSDRLILKLAVDRRTRRAALNNPKASAKTLSALHRQLLNDPLHPYRTPAEFEALTTHPNVTAELHAALSYTDNWWRPRADYPRLDDTTAT